MAEGFVRIHRKLRRWGWFNDSQCVHLLVTILIEAKEKKCKFMGHDIARGEVVAGRGYLSSITGISEQSVRTRIRWMADSGEIVLRKIESEGRAYGVIRVVNYDAYQTDEQEKEAKKPKKKSAADKEPKALTPYKKAMQDARSKPYSEDFERWWKEYMHGNKHGAWFGWLEASEKPCVEDIIDATRKYKKLCVDTNRKMVDGQGFMRQKYFETDWSVEAQGIAGERNGTGADNGITYG